MDHKALKSIFTNAQSEEELNIGLEHHGISKSDLLSIAQQNGWQPGPYAIAEMAVSPDTTPATPEFIEATNKASIRRLHYMLETTVASLYRDIARGDISTPAALDLLEQAIKNRVQLTKMELPMYGLAITEPLPIVNPIQVVMSDGTPANPEEESGDNPK